MAYRLLDRHAVFKRTLGPSLYCTAAASAALPQARKHLFPFVNSIAGTDERPDPKHHYQGTAPDIEWIVWRTAVHRHAYIPIFPAVLVELYFFWTAA
jgi:hypothetical protein